MRRLQTLLAVVAILCGFNVGFAEVAPYTMDFNKSIATSGDWVVGTGWSRLKDRDGNTAPSYSHYTWYGDQANGAGSNGALYTGVQGAGYDLLITPPVKGKVSIRVAPYNGNVTDPYIEVYEVSEFMNNYIFEKDEMLLPSNYQSEIKSAWTGSIGTSYITIDFPETDDYTLYGIRGNNICIDNFMADSADIDLVKSAAISNAYFSTTNFDMDEDGLIPVRVYVVLQNNGDLPLSMGDVTFNIVDKSGETPRTLVENKTFAYPSDLAPGNTYSEMAEFIIDPKDYEPDYKLNLVVTENFKNTSYTIPEKTFTPIPHTPLIRLNYSGKDFTNGETKAYPPSKYATYLYYYVYNDGAAPLTINSIDIPDGFKFGSTYNFPLTLNAHGSQYMSIMLPADVTPGKYSGQVVFNTNADNYADGKYVLNLSAQLLGQNQYFLDGGNPPANMINDGTWTSVSISNYNTVNNYSAFLAKGDVPSKLITPLLKVSEGEKLSFSLARSNQVPEFKVYHSTDRKNWTLIKTVGATELSDSLLGTDYINNQFYPFSDFEVEVPAGERYLAFESASIMLDNVVIGEEVAIDGADLYLKAVEADATATVNNPWEMKVTLYNTTYVAVPADSYTAVLYINDTKVGEANPVEIGGQRDTKFVFRYTPVETGAYTAVVKLGNEDWTMETDEIEFTVNPEGNSRMVQVGQHTVANSQVPYPLSSTYGEAEALYTADILKLKPGTVINKIRYRGAFNTWANEFNQKLSLWIENTEDAGFNTDEPLQLHPTDGMTQVANEVETRVTKRGTVNTSTSPVTISESDNIIEFTLSEPFVYTGGNLRIVSTNANINYTGEVYFEADGTITNMAMSRNGWGLPLSSNFVLQPLPVVYFGIESEPSVITGTVTDKESGSPVSGLLITATDENNVSYQATTDEQGKYTMNIYQDMHPYVLKIAKAGYMPVKRTLTPQGESTQDFVIEVARGLFIDETMLPASAIKNYQAKVSAVVLNPMETKQEADYVAKLIVAGQPVAESDVVEVEAGDTHTFTFNFTPHTVGDNDVVVRIEHANEFVAESESKVLNVDDEMYEGRLQLTENKGTFQTYAPFHGNYYGTHSEMIIDKADVTFNAGTVIKSVVFRGWVSGAETVSKGIHLTAYLENTEDGQLAPLAQFVPRDFAAMTKIFDEDITLYGGGSSNSTRDVLVLPIENGFEYGGEHMRLVIVCKSKDSTTGANWENGDNHRSDNHVYARIQGYSQMGTDEYNNWSDNVMGYPTVYMEIETFKTISGNVTGTGDADMAGTEVVLVSGDVEYTGEVDEAGDYSIRVAQPTLDYTATASLRGYRDASAEVSFAEGNTSWNAFLKAYYDNTYAEGQRAAVSLPFSLSAAEMNELGKFFVLDGIKDGNIYFVEAESVVANQPYVFEAAQAGNPFADFAATEVYAPEALVKDEISFVGADENTTLDSDAETTYFVMDASGNFVKATQAEVEMFTAYLYGSDIDLDSLTFTEGEANGILTIGSEEGELRIFTIDGRQVKADSNLAPGIYVVNGKKVLVK